MVAGLKAQAVRRISTRAKPSEVSI
ncbi:MAG: hypothetical protein Q605_AUC00609G0001, partial [Actinomyces urogenitalis DORA_12]